MHRTTTTTDLEALAALTPSVRAIAVAIVRDAHLAEDVVQDALAATNERGFDGAREPRRWFAGFVRNVARRTVRQREIRCRREREAARGEATESAVDVVARTEIHKRLVATVLELPEPYRATILLRYFDDLTPREIAERHGVAHGTVRSRLTRAVEMLRGHLDRQERGDRRAWALALVPLLAGRSRVSAPLARTGAIAGLGVIIMSAKLKVVAVVTAVLVLAALTVHLAQSPPLQPRASPSSGELSGTSTGQLARKRVHVVEEALAPRVVRPVDEVAPTAEEPPPDSPSRLDVPLDPAAFPKEPALHRLGRLAGLIPIRIVVSENAATLLREQRPMGARIVTVSFTGRSALDELLREWRVQYVLDGDVVRVFLDTEVVSEIGSWEETPVIDEVTPLDVWGTVVDGHGKAVADASIVQLLDQDFPRAQSDNAGRFHTRLREPYGSLEARVPGRTTSPAQVISGAPGGSVSVVLAIGGVESKLSVSVVAGATPIAGALVLMHQSQPQEPEQSTRSGGRASRQVSRRTDRDGDALFDGLSAGAVTVKVYADGYQPVTQELQLQSGTDEALVVEMTRREAIADRVRRTMLTFRLVDETPSNIVNSLSLLLDIPIVLSPRVAEATAHRRVSLPLGGGQSTRGYADALLQSAG